MCLELFGVGVERVGVNLSDFENLGRLLAVFGLSGANLCDSI